MSRIYLRGKQWSNSMPEMLKEDKVTSVINILVAIIILGITIVVNIFYKPLVGFYLVSCFLLLVGSSVIFPPKGRKIEKNCYVMRYHRDHFIVTLNDHKIYIMGERFVNNSDAQIIFKEDEPRWLPPYESDPVSEKDYDYIFNAILKFLEKQKAQGIIEHKIKST
jgi:hypothetical protein